MSGRQHPANRGPGLDLPLVASGLDAVSLARTLAGVVDGVVESVRTNIAILSRSLADRLVGPVERWCPICELELQLHASDTSCLAHDRDDDA